MKLRLNLLSLVLVGVLGTAAHADPLQFDFTFSNTIGDIPGTVSGVMIGNLVGTTYTPTSIDVTSYPLSLRLPPATDVFGGANPISGTFTVSTASGTPQITGTSTGILAYDDPELVNFIELDYISYNALQDAYANTTENRDALNGITFTAAPEPSAWALGALGLLVFWRMRMRRFPGRSRAKAIPTRMGIPPNMKTNPAVRFFAVSALVLLTFPASSLAQTNEFKAGTNWNSTADWSLNHVPATTDALLFDHTHLNPVPSTTLGGSFTAQHLSFNTGADSFGIDANASGTTTAQTLTLENNGGDALGLVDDIDLSSTTTGTITLGGNVGQGTLVISMVGSSNNDFINVQNAVANLVFGVNSVLTAQGMDKEGAGTLTLNGVNTFTTGAVVGDGTLNINGTITSTNPTNGLFVVDSTASGTATANLNSGGSLTATGEYVGGGFNGTFNQSGGTNTIAITDDIYGVGLTLGQFGGATGVYTLSGGTLQTPSVVGGAGTSTFNFNGGTLQANSSTTSLMSGLTTANVQAGGAVIDTNGNNAVTLDQSLVHDASLGSTIDGGLTKIGAGTLTLTHANSYTGKTFVTAGTLAVTGSIDSPVSNMVVDGASAPQTTLGTGGSITTANTEIGVVNTGGFTQNDGNNTVENQLTVGYSFGSSGSYTLGGGMLTANSATIGLFGAGTVTQTDGTANISQLTLGANAYSNGAYNLSGGTVESNTENVGTGGTATFTQTGGANSAGNLNVGTGSSYSISSTSGPATLNVSGNTTNNGTMTITGQPSGSVNLGNYTAIGGILITDPSTINFTSLYLDPTSAIEGSAGDVFNITGNLTDKNTNPLSNLSGVTLDFKGGGTHTIIWAGLGPIGTLELAAGDLLTLNLSTNLMVETLTLDGGAADLANLDVTGGNIYYDPNLAANAYLNDQSYTLAGGGHLDAESVPEPSSWVLSALGLLVLWRMRRLHIIH